MIKPRGTRSRVVDPVPATAGAGADWPLDRRVRVSVPFALLYHGMATLPPGASYVERGLFVDPANFARHMEQLAQRGYRTLRLDEYARALEGQVSSTKCFLLTFDDGYSHLEELVTPVLRRHHYSAVVFVPLAHVGAANVWDSSHPHLFGTRIMSKGQLRSLDPDLWEVESHGMQHVDLRKQDPVTRRRELQDGRERLSALLGRAVRALAYPYGYHDQQVREDAASAGFGLAFTASGYGRVEKLRLPRRSISGWDPLALIRVRTSPLAPSLYRIEDAARAAIGLRRLLGN